MIHLAGFGPADRVSGVGEVSRTVRPVPESETHPSPRVAARQADARRRILDAARVVVAEQGFAAAQVAVVA